MGIGRAIGLARSGGASAWLGANVGAQKYVLNRVEFQVTFIMKLLEL